MPAHAPRSLADQLRRWPESRVAALLEVRADLAVPAPDDTSQLASRASGKASVTRALDLLTRLELGVLDALVALSGSATAAQLREAVRADPDAVDAALERVVDLALVWGGPPYLRMVAAAAEQVGTSLSALGPSAADLLAGTGPGGLAALLADLGGSPTGDRAEDLTRVTAILRDQEQVAALVGDAGAQAAAMLDHLDRTGVLGSTARASVRVDAARTPVEQLVARGLLMATEQGPLAVPREVSLALRGGHTTYEPLDDLPQVRTRERPIRLIDASAAGAAFELVQRVELLLESWTEKPPPALRAGGLGVRDLRSTASMLQVDERGCIHLLETVAAAGLVGLGRVDSVDTAWLPTEAYDLWRAATVARRWQVLVDSWLKTPRLPGLVGSSVAGRTLAVLGHDLERGWAPALRRTVLTELAGLPAGATLEGQPGVESLVARIGWLAPRRPPVASRAVAWLVEEAALLGLTGLGALASPGRALIGGSDPVEVMGRQLPSPVERLVFQADLTAVAPGPLADRAARDVGMLAQVESRGAATVYRFTAGSLRRSFDAGWSAQEVHAALDGLARDGVPQTLRFLVDDVARTFGTLRLGVASSFVRSDDEAALAALLHHDGGLRLRRLAPTVLVTDAPLDVVLPRLRELGVAPVVEGLDGLVTVAGREPPRAHSAKYAVDRQPGRRTSSRGRPSANGAVSGTGAVSARAGTAGSRAEVTAAAIRAGDRVAQTHGTSTRHTPASALAALRESVDLQASVVIGFVDSEGTLSDRVVDPIRVEGGWLRAFDQRTEQIRSFAVHRISSVRPATS